MGGEEMDEWWEMRRAAKPMRRADAFTQARAGDGAAVGKLLEIVADTTEGPLMRANAIGYLARFGGDARVFPMFEWALGDEHPMVRAVAALRIPQGSVHRAEAIRALAAALTDKVATVRLGAVVSLVGLGVRDFKEPYAKPFEEARKLYEQRAAFNNDDAGQQLAAGRFYLLTGNPEKAAAALSASLKIDPSAHAEYFLAYAWAQQGKYEQARALLEKIGTGDPQYVNAQTLLKAIATK